MTIGKVATIATPATCPQSVPCGVTSPGMPTVRVRDSKAVRIMANNSSFQLRIKHKTAVAAMPGAARGNSTFMNVPALVLPSICAASSISLGMSSKNPRIIQTTSDKLNDVCAKITAESVSTSPNLEKIRNMGTTTEMAGAIRVVRKKKNKSSFPAKLCRAKTYAAGTPTSNERKVQESATIMLLPTSGKNFLSINTLG